jgi:hypothetical protein
MTHGGVGNRESLPNARAAALRVAACPCVAVIARRRPAGHALRDAIVETWLPVAERLA